MCCLVQPTGLARGTFIQGVLSQVVQNVLSRGRPNDLIRKKKKRKKFHCVERAKEEKKREGLKRERTRHRKCEVRM